eukprot:jgi/Botrbrau1/22896/Bobra.0065s0049.1
MSRAAESGSGHQQPLRQMLHVASRLMSTLFARRPLLIPSSWISRKTSWTTWLNFEAINISEAARVVATPTTPISDSGTWHVRHVSTT